MHAVVAAIHRRSRAVVGVRLGDRVQRFSLDAADACCPEEAIVRGWTQAVTSARALGATAVTIVVNRPLLVGYLRLGWRIRSLAMLGAMRDLANATVELDLEFRYPYRQVAPHQDAVADR